jgi:signal transduction histidine kinase
MEPSTDPVATPPALGEYRSQFAARSIVATFLAIAAILAKLGGYYQDTVWRPLGACAFILTYNELFYFAKWIDRNPKKATLCLLFLDILALTSYLHFTGDIENPLMFAYALPVVAGAVLVSRRAGLLLGAMASLSFFTMMVFMLWDQSPIRLDHHHLGLMGGQEVTSKVDPDDFGWSYILSYLFVLEAVLFGSAYGFGALTEKLRQREADLIHQNERLQLLLGILPEGVVLLGKDGSILHRNAAASTLLNGADGTTVRALDPKLGLAERFDQFNGSVEEFETEFGERVFEHALARRSPGGPVVWVFRDTTDHRRLLAQVMHQSKMVDLGLLAAGIAHEIGNPLSSMSAILQLLRMKPHAPEVAERLRSVENHVDRIHRIVQDITGFARPSAGNRSKVDARALLEKALQIFRFHDKAKETKVDVSAPDAVPVDVVEDQIVQVLLNLLLNAADASGGKGTVSVAVGQQAGGARLSVTDRGVGIGQETRQRLFTPFFTTKEQGKGSGLGLFISESIARAHGGSIEVRSEPGHGSTFTLCLPLRVSEVRV